MTGIEWFEAGVFCGFFMGLGFWGLVREVGDMLRSGLPVAPRKGEHLDNQTTRVTAYPSGRGSGDVDA